MTRVLGVGLLTLVGCTEPAIWRPAKGVDEQERVTDRATRVMEVPKTCTYLGVVHGEGDEVLKDIGITAANHGATHYVLQNDHRWSEGYETRGIVTRPADNVAFVRTQTTELEYRKAWAKAYRCP